MLLSLVVVVSLLLRNDVQAFTSLSPLSSSSSRCPNQLLGSDAASTTTTTTTTTALHLFGIRPLRWFRRRRGHGRRDEEEEPNSSNSIETKDQQQQQQPDVGTLFDLWNDALQTGDSSCVVQRYASNAVLLPTVSNEPRCDPPAIQDYFDRFLTRRPHGTIRTSHVHRGPGWCLDSGIYEFSMGVTGDKVAARYSFLYVPDDKDGTWKILHHHSSVLPETHKAAPPLTQQGVRDLFHMWNRALSTRNPERVASRYAKTAVLLPALSDTTPRTDPASIRAYYHDYFSTNRAVGSTHPYHHVVQQSSVRVGTDWAQDVGIYSCSLGDGTTPMEARYSFTYVWEEGDWKIAHHHASLLPEANLALQKQALSESTAVLQPKEEEKEQEEAVLLLSDPQTKERNQRALLKASLSLQAKERAMKLQQLAKELADLEKNEEETEHYPEQAKLEEMEQDLAPLLEFTEQEAQEEKPSTPEDSSTFA